MYRNTRPLVAIGAVLCIAALPAFSKRAPSKDEEARRQAKLFHTKLDKNTQLLHALDRLTFGPRPGDVDRVRRVGLKKWIDQQLHPERIAESTFLEARLQPLESLRMTPMQAVQHYPPPQLIRAIAEGRQPMPEDPELRASVERLVARYRVKKGDANAKPEEDMEPAKPLDEILSPAELQTLHTGKPEEKRAVLTSMRADQLEDVVIALPRPMRQQLFQFAPTELKRKLLLMNAPQQVVAYDLLASKLMRAVYSNRQLAEELDDFWFNHFNVYYDKGSDRFLIPGYERDAIRPNVLGKFRDLLEATAKSPAMLFYLDNFQSVGPDAAVNARAKKKRGLNENYGRELMELHTLGVDGGYTQKDVTEVARCFTGWTIQEPRRAAGFLLQRQNARQGRESGARRDHPRRRRHRRRREGPGHSGAPSFHRSLHFEKARATIRRRQSAAGIGRPHGRHVPQERRRYPRGRCAPCSTPRNSGRKARIMRR